MIVYTGGPARRQYQLVSAAVTTRDYESLYGMPWVDDAGCIHYSKKGPEPPTPTGYELVPGDDWQFRPVWPSCAHRLLRVLYVEDGSLRVEGLCGQPASSQLPHEPLSVSICNDCPHRRPIT